MSVGEGILFALACLAGWVALSVAAAFVFGGVIRLRERHRR